MTPLSWCTNALVNSGDLLEQEKDTETFQDFFFLRPIFRARKSDKAGPCRTLGYTLYYWTLGDTLSAGQLATNFFCWTLC
jgi:hypothetical protein